MHLQLHEDFEMRGLLIKLLIRGHRASEKVWLMGTELLALALGAGVAWGLRLAAGVSGGSVLKDRFDCC